MNDLHEIIFLSQNPVNGWGALGKKNYRLTQLTEQSQWLTPYGLNTQF